MRLLLIPSLAVLLCACSTDHWASQTGDSFGSLVRITCSSAEFGEEQYERFFKDLPYEDRRDIEDTMKQERQACAALESIYDVVKESHEELSSGYFIPRSRYIFSIQVSGTDIRPVGFFRDEKQCEASRQLASNAGFDTMACETRILFYRLAWG